MTACHGGKSGIKASAFQDVTVSTRALNWPTNLASATEGLDTRVRVRVFWADRLAGLVEKVEAVNESEESGTGIR